MFAVKINQVWQIIDGPFVKDDVQYPHNWAELATPEERDALEVAEVVIDHGIKPSEQRIGQRVVDRDGRPVLEIITSTYSTEEATQMLWDRIKRERDRRIGLGATTEQGVFDADDTGRVNIAGAVQMAQILGDAFAIDWTLHTNEVKRLNAAQMIAAGMAVGQFYSAQHARSQQMRTTIPTLSVDEMFVQDVEAWWDGADPVRIEQPPLPPTAQPPAE